MLLSPQQENYRKILFEFYDSSNFNQGKELWVALIFRVPRNRKQKQRNTQQILTAPRRFDLMEDFPTNRNSCEKNWRKLSQSGRLL